MNHHDLEVLCLYKEGLLNEKQRSEVEHRFKKDTDWLNSYLNLTIDQIMLPTHDFEPVPTDLIKKAYGLVENIPPETILCKLGETGLQWIKDTITFLQIKPITIAYRGKHTNTKYQLSNDLGTIEIYSALDAMSSYIITVLPKSNVTFSITKKNIEDNSERTLVFLHLKSDQTYDFPNLKKGTYLIQFNDSQLTIVADED